MGKTAKNPPAAQRRSPPPRHGQKPAAVNPRLIQQTRKILGKHYAAKYRVT